MHALMHGEGSPELTIRAKVGSALPAVTAVGAWRGGLGAGSFAFRNLPPP